MVPVTRRPWLECSSRGGNFVNLEPTHPNDWEVVFKNKISILLPK